MTAQYRHKVEPLLYFLKLLLGIFCIIISLILIIQLFAYVLLKVNGKPASPFLNTMLEKIEVSKASVVATVIFALLGYYMMICTIKGNVRVGMRFFCITFYPLR